MKKLSRWLLAMVCILSLVACSKGPSAVEVKDGVSFELLDAVRVTNDSTNTVYYYFLASLDNQSKSNYNLDELSYSITDGENHNVHAIDRSQTTIVKNLGAGRSTFVYGYVGYPNNNQKDMGIYFPKNKNFLSFDSIKLRKISDKNVNYSTKDKFTLYSDSTFEFDVDASDMTYTFENGNSVVKGLKITYINKTDSPLVVPYVTPIATLNGINLNSYLDRGNFSEMDLNQIKSVDFKTNDMQPKTEDIQGTASGYECFYLTEKQELTCTINFTFEHAIPNFSSYNPKAITIDLNSAALGYSQEINVKY